VALDAPVEDVDQLGADLGRAAIVAVEQLRELRRALVRTEDRGADLSVAQRLADDLAERPPLQEQIRNCAHSLALRCPPARTLTSTLPQSAADVDASSHAPPPNLWALRGAARH